MENTISIKQELFNQGGRNYDVIMTVDRGDDTEVIEFNYEDTNAIFPLYNSLINTIRGIEDAHVELETVNPDFIEEIKGSPNRNSRLLNILIDVKQSQGVTIDAFLNK